MPLPDQTFRLTLDRSQPNDQGTDRSVRATITAESLADGVASEIFIFFRNPDTWPADEANPVDVFQGIAFDTDYAAIGTYPTDEQPLFRKATATFVFEDILALDSAWSKIQADVRRLDRQLRKAEALTVQVQVSLP